MSNPTFLRRAAGAFASLAVAASLGMAAQPAQAADTVDQMVTWTTRTTTKDCSSKAYADLATGKTCGKGMAYAYAQNLSDQQPQTDAELRAYLTELRASLSPGQSVTVQTDRYVATQAEIDAVTADGRLTAGEDSRINKGWHVIVLTAPTTTDRWVTWIATNNRQDCSAVDYADIAEGELCGKGLAHNYPQPLAPKQPNGPAEFGAYLEELKAQLAPGETITVQMDRYVGDTTAVDKVLADGFLTVGEDQGLVQDWRVAVLTGE